MIDRSDRGARPTAVLGEGVDLAIVRARREVIERHRRLELPLAIWRGGHVALVSPHDVPRDELPTVDAPSPR